MAGFGRGWIASGLLLAGAAAIVCGSLYSGFAANAQVASPAARSSADARLSQVCETQTVQRVAASLKAVAVTVKKIEHTPHIPGSRFVPASGKTPAYCQVTGSYVTNPNSGKTANFLATLPANWNGKYLQLGCGGHCGNLALGDPSSAFITVGNQGKPNDILSKGYAAFATDEGHVGTAGGTWAIKGPGQVDEDAIADFLYRSQKVLARMGKEFTVAFYDRVNGSTRKIARSYFSGCSGGGRDALVAASYFPEEFDGFIAGSAYNQMGRAFHGAVTAVATLRTPDADVPPSLLALVDPIVKKQCDALDGVKDGLIQNPAACDFRPERDLPRCAADKPGAQCFTKAQVETLSVVLSAVTDERGRVVQPGQPVSEMLPSFAPGVRPQNPNAAEPWPDGVDTLIWSLSNASLKVFTHKNDPNFTTRSIVSFKSGAPGPVTSFRGIVPRSEVDLAMAAGRLGIGHFPENAARLIKLDRKLLMWHNLSDEKLTPYMSINYYKQLARRHGGYANLQKNVRLFALPGTSHCSGGGPGVGPGSFDALTAMENWVEKNQAPNALLATLYQPGARGVDFSKPGARTMPLCTFPEMARYRGKGDVKDAANWRCPSNDQRMLTIGESGRRAGVTE